MISGSNINLTCRVTGTPEPPQYIYWYREGSLINYSSRGGISVVTDKLSRTSRLVVTRAKPADSGNYTCAPANADPASVNVYIISGKDTIGNVFGNVEWYLWCRQRSIVKVDDYSRLNLQGHEMFTKFYDTTIETQ